MKRQFKPVGTLLYLAVLLAFLLITSGLSGAGRADQLAYTEVVELFAEERVREFSLSSDGSLLL